MKIKIIDILNTIARGEEPPKKIVFRNEVYEYDAEDGDYRNNDYTDAIFDYHEITDILNDEVEILETTIHNKKKIEPLKYEVFTMFAEDKPIKEEIYIDNKDLLKTINDITDYLMEK